MGSFKDNYIIQAWLVLILTLLFGSSLAGIERILAPRIQENKLNEMLELVPDLIQNSEKKDSLSNLKIDFKEFEVLRDNRKIFYNVIHTSKKGATSGWIIRSSGQGYADKIELLIGFDPHMKFITGLFILEQKETPGLGNKITHESWRDQFLNIETEYTLSAVKSGADNPGEIDAITGATISSRSVCTIVNTVIKDLKKPLKAEIARSIK